MTARSRSQNDSETFLSCFASEFGWFGIAGAENVVRAVFVGHPTKASVKQAAAKWTALDQQGNSLVERDWNTKLRERLIQYTEGRPVVFDDFEIELPGRTVFRDKVLNATRRLGYGQTTTYGDLARTVGHTGAARAVGTVMSTNRLPILIPCHRVLASGGKLGGYTAPSGTDLKQRLLDLENSTASPR